MAFATGDRKRIADALKLHQEQYFANSLLATLMSDLEAVDAAQGTTFVTDVQSALTSVETLDTSIASSASSDALASLSVDNQYSETYRAAGGATASLKADRSGHIEDIYRWLDPNDLLRSYSTQSRVIQTL